MHNNILPKYFLFVDQYNKENFKNYKANLGIIYRNYSKSQNKKDILNIKLHCKKKGFKFYVSNNLRLAIALQSDGIYIPAFNKKLIINKSNLKRKFHIIGSAHNQTQIRRKKEQGCEAIFLSPLFKIKKNKNKLGICKFNLLTLSNKSKFIALGGINSKNIRFLKILNIYGMAGINYFKKKTGLINRPVFVNQFNDNYRVLERHR